jgi:hypothetical protein
MVLIINNNRQILFCIWMLPRQIFSKLDSYLNGSTRENCVKRVLKSFQKEII